MRKRSGRRRLREKGNAFLSFFLSFSSSVYTGTSLTLVRDVDLAHGGPRREHSDLHVFKIKI